MWRPVTPFFHLILFENVEKYGLVTDYAFVELLFPREVDVNKRKFL